MYLQDTGMIQDKHRDILIAASQEVLGLIAGPTLTLIPNLTGLPIVDVDKTMGNYADNMDKVVFLIYHLFSLNNIR
jgi:hypothetical protein